jgi:hypothetical protein
VVRARNPGREKRLCPVQFGATRAAQVAPGTIDVIVEHPHAGSWPFWRILGEARVRAITDALCLNSQAGGWVESVFTAATPFSVSIAIASRDYALLPISCHLLGRGVDAISNARQQLVGMTLLFDRAVEQFGLRGFAENVGPCS